MQKIFLPCFLIFSALTGCGLLTQEPDAKWMSSFSVAEGLELTLWAAEPDLVNPTNMDIDDRGRIWVVESINTQHTTEVPYRCMLGVSVHDQR